jgi:hypothetical protein
MTEDSKQMLLETFHSVLIHKIFEDMFAECGA